MGKGFGVRDREFALFFIKTDFFYNLNINSFLRFSAFPKLIQITNLRDYNEFSR